jgi:4-phytase/acid phosphatase
MRLSFVSPHSRSTRGRRRLAQRIASRGRIAAASLVLLGLARIAAVPSALAQEQAVQAPSGALLKVVILSRHGVRSPIVKQPDLNTWSASGWPAWRCPTLKPFCDPGELTFRGASLAKQMGEYYRSYELFPAAGCPPEDDLFFWADTDERTLATGQALLKGLLPGCEDAPARYMRSHAKKSPDDKDKIFHPVTGHGSCKLDVDRAEKDMLKQAGGSFARYLERIRKPLKMAQCTLQCCLDGECKSWWQACGLKQEPPACTLKPPCTACLGVYPADAPTRIEFNGSARVASTFAEIVLLEYANGFPERDVGFGRVGKDEMYEMFRAHTEAFEVEQRTPYIAKLQGSRLVTKMLLALAGMRDGKEGTAPAQAKFVAYVGHDTNIANVAAMLGLAWEQPPYQKNQTPPAGALIFELRKGGDGKEKVYAFYAAQSLEDMRDRKGSRATSTPLSVMELDAGKGVDLNDFANFAKQARDRNQNCWN